MNTVERDQGRAANEVDSGWADLGERHPRLQVALLSAAAYEKNEIFFTRAGLTTKVNRGVFASTYFLQCMAAMKVETLHLED